MKYQLREEVQLRKTNEEGFVYDRKKEKVHVVNLTAYEILSMIKDKKELNEIIEEFKHKYNISSNIVQDDVFEAIRQFEDLEIIIQE